MSRRIIRIQKKIEPQKKENFSRDNYITEDNISYWVDKNKGFLFTRKFKNTSIKTSRYFCLTGYKHIIEYFCKNYLNKIKKPIVLILIESDVIKILSVILEHPMIEKIFTWNKEINHPKIKCIPIGLNKDRHLEMMSNTPKNIEKDKLVLINFNVNNDPSRQKILENKELMKISENIRYMEPENVYHSNSFTDGKIKVEVTNKDFYKEMSKFKFVISPRGAGEDCHRTWEALYLGCVPVVLSSSINEIYEDLPVLVVNNWDEITEEFLNKKWEEFQNREWNWSKIKTDYWFKKFEESEEEKVNFITYGNDVFFRAKKRIVKEAQNFYNFKSVTSYGPEDLEKDFKEKYQDVLSQKRGGGYWIWRYHIISRLLKKYDEGEILIYLDAGCHFNSKGMKRFREYLDLLKNSKYGMLSFQMHNQKENWWSVKEIFNYFDIDRESEIGNSGQYLGGIIFIKKCQHSIDFINKMLQILEKDRNLFTDHYNNSGQVNYFKENRHEQSVSSILRKIMGSEVIPRDETFFQKFGNEKSLDYPIWAVRSKK